VPKTVKTHQGVRNSDSYVDEGPFFPHGQAANQGEDEAEHLGPDLGEGRREGGRKGGKENK